MGRHRPKRYSSQTDKTVVSIKEYQGNVSQWDQSLFKLCVRPHAAHLSKGSIREQKKKKTILTA